MVKDHKISAQRGGSMGANIDLARLKSLLDAATAGPWRVAENEWNLKSPPWREAVGVEMYDPDNAELAVPGLLCWLTRSGQQQETAHLIAALRNSAPALISELESLRARMADAKKVAEAVRFWESGPFTTTSKATARLDLLDALAHFDAQEGK